MPFIYFIDCIKSIIPLIDYTFIPAKHTTNQTRNQEKRKICFVNWGIMAIFAVIKAETFELCHVSRL